MENPVTILHLSDLHFGRNSRFPGNESKHRDWGERLAGVVSDVAAKSKISSLE